MRSREIGDIGLDAKYFNRHNLEEPIGGWFKDKWEAAKKDIKEVANKVVDVVKEVPKVAKKVTVAPVRNAFLLLVTVNARKLATNLSKAIVRNPNKVRQFWQFFGGNYDQLKKVAENAKDKKSIGGLDAIGYAISNEPKVRMIRPIGVTGAEVTAAIAAATPVIVAVLPLLKEILGSGEVEDTNQILTTDAVDAYNDGAYDNFQVPNDFPNTGGSGGSGSEAGFLEKNWKIILGGTILLIGGAAYVNSTKPKRKK